jgi:hypothetical protein
MGKVLVGCLVVVVLIVAGGGTAGYYMFVKPYATAVLDAGRMAEEYGRLNDSITNRAPYRAPADGALQTAQLERFLAAHRTMKAELKDTLEKLEARYDALQRDLEASGREPGLREMFGAYRDLGALYLAAKRAQVAAINAQGLSLDEYVWIRNASYQALGQRVAVMSFDAAAAAGGTQTYTPTVPTGNLELVAPYEDELLETYVLAWFGL